MRRAKGWRREQRTLGRQQAGDGVDARHLERFLARQRRQQRGQPSGEHRLAGSRRSREKDVVLAGGGDLERPPAALLPADVCQIGTEAVARRSVRGCRGLQVDLTAKV